MSSMERPGNETEGKKFIVEYKRMLANTKMVEKDWHSSMNQANKLFPSDLLESEKKFNKEYHQELLKIQTNIKKTQCQVNKFKHELSGETCAPNVNKIKYLMEMTENFITEFKESQQQVFSELLKDEKTCDNEIALINTRIESLSQPSDRRIMKNTSSKSSISHNHSKENNLPCAVLKFQKFVDSKGVTGGWDEQDHSTFLKLIKKYKGPPNRFHEFAKSSMPFRAVDDISEHYSWFKRYKDLKRDKIRAIENWRLQKEEESKQSLVDGNVELQVSPPRKHISEEEQAKKKKMIAEWKKAKLEEEEAEKQRKLKEEARRHQNERKKLEEIRMEQEEVLLKLRAKREKEQREEWANEMEEQEIAEERRRRAASDMRKFQARDQMLLEHKIHVKKLKEKEIEITKQKLERTKERVFVARDSNRLYELTEACIQRQNAEDDSIKMLNKIPHRAVPGWRQAL